MTTPEAAEFIKNATIAPLDQRTYRQDKYGPMRVGLGTGKCACNRRISLNKPTCRECDGKDLEFIIPGSEPEIAPGVRGYMKLIGHELYIPLITAEQEGSGAVSMFLDKLPTTLTVKFPDVVNEKFVGMLQRRGFVCVIERHQETDEDVAVWARMAIQGG